jgi:hypothetical protein
MPGIGDEIDGAMQHAPQALRHLVVMMNLGMESNWRSGCVKEVKTLPELWITPANMGTL